MTTQLTKKIMQKKLEMITFYNKTKIGVDLVDQLCEKYNVARNTH
jgi:CO dehydrogenase/acetyl-CoA synthase gamma subunit (corrinoid Fe-S protein)